MSFEEFKEKFDSFFEKVTAEELISEFERLACPVERTDENFPIESDRKAVDTERIVSFEHVRHFSDYGQGGHKYFFEVETDRPFTCKKLKVKLKADFCFHNGTDLPLAA
ncbi:MAG: hypothetical protein DRI57_19160 [Deltaproteobacteria bacterium]|nr:MAG: hypothetical protein DRI57_19160 [Deltaproteobacteria bacterium]